MDSESDCSVLESVEDNEGIVDVSTAENLENICEPKVQNNGSCTVENNGTIESYSEMKGKRTEGSGSVNLHPQEIIPTIESYSEMKGKRTEGSGSVNLHPQEIIPEVFLSSAMTRKGYGLKKWRRIKREANKGAESSSIDTGNMVMQNRSNSGMNSSKRMQFFSEGKQKSEGSVSSIIATVRNLDGFDLLGDSGFAMDPSFGAGADLDNSEDRSSKSSTAASAPKIRGESSVLMGFPLDKSRMRSFSGKNLTNSMQRGQQGKGRIETGKNSRGEKVKIEKENSHSSMESDSQSSNFVFMQGTYSTSNGIPSERSIHNGDNVDEVHGIEQRVSDGLQGGYCKDGRGYEDASREDVGADSSGEGREERSQNNGSSTDVDPLAESIAALQSVQELIEMEVLKFREISKDVLVDDVNQKLQETSSEVLQSGEVGLRFPFAEKSEVLDIANNNVETEIEDLFKQKIEAEVEYLAISRTIQHLRVATVDQITILEEQRNMALKQTQILNKLGDTEKKAVKLEKEAEKLENLCEDIASVDETLKLQRRVYKYTSCFFVQLVLLVLILGIFKFQLSPKYVELVPT